MTLLEHAVGVCSLVTEVGSNPVTVLETYFAQGSSSSGGGVPEEMVLLC